jgi:hypothetical protein
MCCQWKLNAIYANITEKKIYFESPPLKMMRNNSFNCVLYCRLTILKSCVYRHTVILNSFISYKSVTTVLTFKCLHAWNRLLALRPVSSVVNREMLFCFVVYPAVLQKQKNTVEKVRFYICCEIGKSVISVICVFGSGTCIISKLLRNFSL